MRRCHQGGFVLEPRTQSFIVLLWFGVLFATGAPGTFHERLTRPWIAFAGFAALALTASDIVARAGTNPSCQLARIRELTHIRTRLGDDRRRRFPDSWNRLGQFSSHLQLGVCLYVLGNLFLEIADFFLQKCQMLHRMPD